MEQLSAGRSREAAKECSPRRKPWVIIERITKPRRGERKVTVQTWQGWHEFSHTRESQCLGKIERQTSATEEIADINKTFSAI
jgi:hypothetical protein